MIGIVFFSTYFRMRKVRNDGKKKIFTPKIRHFFWPPPMAPKNIVHVSIDDRSRIILTIDDRGSTRTRTPGSRKSADRRKMTLTRAHVHDSQPGQGMRLRSSRTTCSVATCRRCRRPFLHRRRLITFYLPLLYSNVVHALTTTIIIIIIYNIL